MRLERFKQAQEQDYETALAEVKKGRKRSHWMWYIFAQIAGLGYDAPALIRPTGGRSRPGSGWASP